MKAKAPSLPMKIWVIFDADDLAGGQDGLQADHHVLNAAVEGGELADGAGGQQAAHMGQGQGLGIVAGGVTPLVEPALQHGQRGAAADGDHHVPLVELKNLVHVRAVQDDAAHLGLDAQGDAGAARPGSGGDLLFVEELEDFAHLPGGLNFDHAGGFGHGVFEAVMALIAAEADAVLDDDGVVAGENFVLAHNGAQGVESHLIHGCFPPKNINPGSGRREYRPPFHRRHG